MLKRDAVFHPELLRCEPWGEWRGVDVNKWGAHRACVLQCQVGL